METFLNIPGLALNSLLQSVKFRSNSPDSRKTLPSLVSPINVADNYGVRMTTYYVVGIKEVDRLYLYFILFDTLILMILPQAPETGDYTFYVSGDDQCRLSISTDRDPKNLRQIVQFRNRLWTRPNQWEK